MRSVLKPRKMSCLLISNAKPPLARLCFVLLLFVHTHSDYRYCPLYTRYISMPCFLALKELWERESPTCFHLGKCKSRCSV